MMYFFLLKKELLQNHFGNNKLVDFSKNYAKKMINKTKSVTLLKNYFYANKNEKNMKRSWMIKKVTFRCTWKKLECNRLRNPISESITMIPSNQKVFIGEKNNNENQYCKSKSKQMTTLVFLPSYIENV